MKNKSFEDKFYGDPFRKENHPEKKPDESWYINLDTREPDFDHSYAEITFQSKRLGRIAYDINGEEIPNCVPVFVSKEEYKSPITSGWLNNINKELDRIDNIRKPFFLSDD